MNVHCCCYAAKLLQLCPTLCGPIDGSLPGSPVPGILQARSLEWVTISFSNAWKWKVKVKVKSCPTLHDPMDHSLPGSSVHGIFQARVLEWVPLPSLSPVPYVYLKFLRKVSSSVVFNCLFPFKFLPVYLEWHLPIVCLYFSVNFYACGRISWFL